MKLTDLLLGRGREGEDQSEHRNTARAGASGDATGSVRSGCSHDVTLDRRRTQSEYVDRRKRKNKPECEPARGRARTLSSWTSSAGGNLWVLKRKSSVHAVDFGVLQSSHLPDRDDSPDVNVVLNEKTGCEENTCLICMGKATKKKPLVNIPCKNECNLGTLGMSPCERDRCRLNFWRSAGALKVYIRVESAKERHRYMPLMQRRSWRHRLYSTRCVEGF